VIGERQAESKRHANAVIIPRFRLQLTIRSVVKAKMISLSISGAQSIFAIFTKRSATALVKVGELPVGILDFGASGQPGRTE
jgi:hypothetical protein